MTLPPSEDMIRQGIVAVFAVAIAGVAVYLLQFFLMFILLVIGGLKFILPYALAFVAASLAVICWRAYNASRY